MKRIRVEDRRFDAADLRNRSRLTEAGLDASLSRMMVAGFPQRIMDALEEAEREEEAEEIGAETGK